MSNAADFAAFTEDGFRSLLRSLTAGRYEFARFGTSPSGRHVLWRHDVDFSMHRAVKLAEIEAGEGAFATYFLHSRSTFYNLLEPGIVALARRISALGHDIGLHFDTGPYEVREWALPELETAVSREKRLLEAILDLPISVMSWHNPGESNLLDFDQDRIGGLHSAYGRRLRDEYVYCSDSNGYWRFRPMGEVIAAGHERLHLLTHPEWWTPEAMAPSDRIDRAILGRARWVRHDYETRLAAAGRKDVKE